MISIPEELDHHGRVRPPRLVADYASYTRSFIKIADPRISARVESELNAGAGR
jgi:hypothetical protein